MAQFNHIPPAVEQELEFFKAVSVPYSNVRGKAQINPRDTAVVLYVDKNAGDSLYTLRLHNGNTVKMLLTQLTRVARTVAASHIAPPMLVVESNPTFGVGDHVLFARACVGPHVAVNTRGQITAVRAAPDEYVVKLENGRSVRLPLTLIRSDVNPLALISRGDERIKVGYYVSTPDGKRGIVRSADNRPDGESGVALDSVYGIDNLAIYNTRSLKVELAAPPSPAPSRALATVGKGKKRKAPAQRAVPWSDTPTLFNTNDEPVLAQEGDQVKVIAPTNSIFIEDERYEIEVGQIGTITEVRHDGLYVNFPSLAAIVEEIFFDRHEALKVLNIELATERSRHRTKSARRQSYKRAAAGEEFRVKFDCQAQLQDGGQIDCYEGDYVILGEELIDPPGATAAVLETADGNENHDIIVDATWMADYATPIVRSHRRTARAQAPIFVKAALRPKMRRQAFPTSNRPTRSKPKQWVAKRPMLLINFRTGKPELVAAGSTVVEHSNFVTRDKQVGVVLGRQGSRYHYQITRAQLRRLFVVETPKPSVSVRSPRNKRRAPDFALAVVSGQALDLLDELGQWMAESGVGLGEYEVTLSEWDSWSDDAYELFVELEETGYIEPAPGGAGVWAVTNAGLGAMEKGWSVDEEDNTLYSQKRNRRAAPKRLGEGVPNYDSYLNPADNEPFTAEEQYAAWIEKGFNLQRGDIVVWDEPTQEIDEAIYAAAKEQGQDQPDDSAYHFLVDGIDWEDGIVNVTNVTTNLKMDIPLKNLVNAQTVNRSRSKSTRADMPGLGEDVKFNRDYFSPNDPSQLLATEGEKGYVVDYGRLPEGGVLVNIDGKEVHVYEQDYPTVLWWESKGALPGPSSFVDINAGRRALQDGMYITAEKDALLTDDEGGGFQVYEGESYQLTSVNEAAQTARIKAMIAEEAPSTVADELNEWALDFEDEEYDPSESFPKLFYPSAIVSFAELTKPDVFTDDNYQPITTTTLAERACAPDEEDEES